MKRTIQLALMSALLVGFIALGVSDLNNKQKKIEINHLELQSKAAEIKQLQIQYTKLETEQDKLLDSNTATQEQLQKIQAEKEHLEKEKAELQKQVSIKKEQERIAAEKQNKAAQKLANKVTGTSTAYAAETPSNAAKAFIYSHESGNVPCKINGGAIDCNYQGNKACGIGQALPCSKLRNVCSLSDYACQDRWFTNYMQQRYGTWENARAFWQKNKWW